MASFAHKRGNRGKVVVFNPPGARSSAHERNRNEALARKLADIKEYDFAGEYSEGLRNEGSEADHLYFVPHETIVGTTLARQLGIRSAQDLFGGVVPHCFLKSKAIVHGLAQQGAKRPSGWSDKFARAIERFTPPGYTIFSFSDGLVAAEKLLALGDARLKEAFATGGNGQSVAHSFEEVERVLSCASPNDRRPYVLELNLDPVTTVTVGQVQVGELTISYHGTQRTTQDNRGARAYGGSELFLVAGGWEQLLQRSNIMSPETELAIRQATAFDASLVHYPEVVASRRNYDVAQGYDSHGVFRSGVIDQSWRIGGCSGIEVAALEAFALRPEIQQVRGSTFNRYGITELPPGAIVHFEGIDDESGPMQVYTCIEELR